MRDRSATRALVLGLLSLPFGLVAPFAIWPALTALKRIRASKGERRGTSPATAGLVAGIIGLLAAIAGIGYWLLAS